MLNSFQITPTPHPEKFNIREDPKGWIVKGEVIIPMLLLLSGWWAGCMPAWLRAPPWCNEHGNINNNNMVYIYIYIYHT